MKDQILQALTALQFKRLADVEHTSDGNCYGFIPTWWISQQYNIPVDKVRYWLNKLEVAGLVISDRSPNYVLWSLSNVPGYVKGDYKNYFKKAL